MAIRLPALIFFILCGIAEARELSPVEKLNRDKAQCNREADQRYVWLFNMEDWRLVYNTCLRRKLQSLSPRYIATTLEAMRLENECPEILQNERPVELSMVGMEIVNQMTTKDLRRSSADDNIEHHLLLYYQRLQHSHNRVRELRGRNP